MSKVLEFSRRSDVLERRLGRWRSPAVLFAIGIPLTHYAAMSLFRKEPMISSQDDLSFLICGEMLFLLALLVVVVYATCRKIARLRDEDECRRESLALYRKGKR